MEVVVQTAICRICVCSLFGQVKAVAWDSASALAKGR